MHSIVRALRQVIRQFVYTSFFRHESSVFPLLNFRIIATWVHIGLQEQNYLLTLTLKFYIESMISLGLLIGNRRKSATWWTQTGEMAQRLASGFSRIRVRNHGRSAKPGGFPEQGGVERLSQGSYNSCYVSPLVSILWCFPLARPSWKPEAVQPMPTGPLCLLGRGLGGREAPQTLGRYRAQPIYNPKLWQESRELGWDPIRKLCMQAC